MDALREFLLALQRHELASGRWLGVLHILIGRRITKEDGTSVSTGLTWRETAALLKQVRWDREAVREVGLAPDTLPPRNRQNYWFAAITRAGVSSDAARTAADELAEQVKELGYHIKEAPQAT